MKKDIAKLNDNFRKTFVGGQVVTTRSIHTVMADDPLKFKTLIAAIMNYDDFNEDNDPYNEHDFGSLVFDGEKVFWKIDYYQKDKNEPHMYGAENPANAETTDRVLTIMYANEY